MDQVFDTEPFCQGEKVGEILLCIDTIQAEVVIVNEVDEKAGGADSDTRKIYDDIFNGLENRRIIFVTNLDPIFTFVVGP